MEDSQTTDEGFEGMTNAQLREYLQRRLFSGLRYKKEDLVDLCRKVADLNIEPQPTQAEQEQIAAARLKELLQVSTERALPHFTNPYVEWSSAYSDFPKVNLVNIYDYFALTPSPVFNGRTLRRYKSLGAYADVESGAVQSVRCSTNLEGSWVFVRGTIAASQKASATYNAWCLINGEKGTIRGGRCECRAGLGEACRHLACLLFFAMTITDHGLNGAPSPTEGPNKWLPPSAQKLDGSLTVRQLLSKTNGSVQVIERPSWTSSPWKLDEKLSALQRLNPKGRTYVGWTRKICGRPGATVPGSPDPSPAPLMNLLMPPLLKDIVRAYVQSHGQDESSMKELLDGIRQSVDNVSNDEIELVTRTQGDCEEWQRQRWGRVTATKAHAVRTFMGPRGGFVKRLSPVSALKQLCPLESRSLRHVAPIAWGMEHEQAAADAYERLSTLFKWHEVESFERRGLKFLSGEAHVAASIDRLLICKCHPNQPRIVELKCPFSIKDCAPDSAQALGRLKKWITKDEEGRFTLKKSHQYYTQLQVQMAVWNVDTAELFVWTPHADESPIPPIVVAFDRDFWIALKNCIDVFYYDRLLPHLTASVVCHS